MTTDATRRIEIDDLEDFCLEIGIGRVAKLYLRPHITPRHYLARLLVHGELGGALQFLTHTLSRQETVWWACLCLRLVSDPTRKVKQAQAIKSALQWVLDPSETNRRVAGEAGRAATFGTSAGAIAMSVFFAGGSILPPDQPVVRPDPFLTPTIITGTITGLIGEVPPEQAKPAMMRFLALGIGVATGQYRWAPADEH